MAAGFHEISILLSKEAFDLGTAIASLNLDAEPRNRPSDTPLRSALMDRTHRTRINHLPPAQPPRLLLRDPSALALCRDCLNRLRFGVPTLRTRETLAFHLALSHFGEPHSATGCTVLWFWVVSGFHFMVG